jgi:SAM-dependent methyltransferase
MDPSEYRTIYAVEDRHWWYVGMRRITLALLDEVYDGRDDLRILDAGSGAGAAMRYLSRFGQVTGCDISPLALGFCRERGLERLGQASVTALPFAAARFDLVTSFDVLYHRAVGDYRAALREFHRVLRPGGRALLRLPAYDWLRGRHDVVIHTERRFTAKELGLSLCEMGFAIERLTYANTLLFPIALGKRLVEPLLPPGDPGRSDVAPNPPRLDDALSAVLGAEAAWLRRRDLPFGLTVVALAKKEK